LIPTITFPNEDITGPGASFSPTTPVFQDSLVAGVRPLAYCVANPSDPEGETLVVTPSPSDDDGAATLGDETQTKAAVARFLGRRAEAVRVLYACLPPGAYGVTGMHPTGQAWSLPNEAGYCMMGEAPSSGMCGQRPLLSSQGTVFSVGPARTAAACQERFGRLPPEDQERYRRGCLRGDEGERLAKGLLWN
jgi:hypothetical protein